MLLAQRSRLFSVQASIRFRWIFPHKHNHYLEIIFFIDNLFAKKKSTVHNVYMVGKIPSASFHNIRIAFRPRS